MTRRGLLLGTVLAFWPLAAQMPAHAAELSAANQEKLMAAVDAYAGRMAAKAEFDQARGANFVYRPLIGERKPPLDYRKNSSSIADGGG